LKTAIVILNWNGKQLLEKFIPSIVAYSSIPNVEIVVADNASTDNSIQFLKEKFPTITIVKNKENGGFAKGYNDALKYIDADIYALVNSDIEVTENWLKPIVTIFENEQNTAAVQPKILDFKEKTTFEYAGAGGGYIDSLGYPYCRGRIFNELEEDLGQYNDKNSIFWASGACFFIRSKVYHNLCGFDEDYFAHQEEIDLCWRVKNNGYSIKYCGASTVYHIGGATLNELSPRKTFLNFRNSLFSLVKNLPKNKLFPIIFTRLILDGIAGVKFALELKPKHTWAILKSHFSFYKYLNKMLKKRKGLNQTTSYFTIKSIVWQHFILGKKKYSDL
jgi:GT2 family glycosyltransferase